MLNKEVEAALKISELVEEFLKKNPIEADRIDLSKIRKKLNNLKNSEQDQEKYLQSFNRILLKLESFIKMRVIPEIYYFFGCHGGVIINDMGFCEFDSPSFAIKRLLEQMRLAIETKQPYNLEIATCCIEWLNQHHPEEISKFLTLLKQGQFEVINPTYSQPYNLLIGAESNIKQFEFGIRVLRNLGIERNIFYASESSIHPQIPQILKGFNIPKASLRARLLGVNPTAHSARVHWIGLDNTKIDALVDQSGLYNGEYFHGTFFKELPNLLFQAVSRPYLTQILYSSIEDFVMPLPYQTEVWTISKYREVFGKFVSCSEAFNSILLNSEYKYSRDQFMIGDYVFIQSDLFFHNKKSEILLITAEIINSILGLYQEVDNDTFLENNWKTLLLTQAHDCYAVPFVRTGDYSSSQLSKEVFESLNLTPSNINISELSIQLLKKIEAECQHFIKKCLNTISKSIKIEDDVENIIENFLIFNPTNIPRREFCQITYILPASEEISLIHKNQEICYQYQDKLLTFMAEVPAFGYSIVSLVNTRENRDEKVPIFFYEVFILNDNKTIRVKFKNKLLFEIAFNCSLENELFIQNQLSDNCVQSVKIFGKFKNNDNQFELIITQFDQSNRLEFKLNAISINEIILQPGIEIIESYINYPFGIEKTDRTKIQTLDFLWLKGLAQGILFIQKNSQQFIINQESFEIRNIIKKNGEYEFSISCTKSKDYSSILNEVYSYYYNLASICLGGKKNFKEKTKSFLKVNPTFSVINLWRRKNEIFFRIFNPSEIPRETQFKGDLFRNKIYILNLANVQISSQKSDKLIVEPWKIITFKFS